MQVNDELDIEEKLISENERKHKKHYLNPNAKAFVHKLLKVVKGGEK